MKSLNLNTSYKHHFIVSLIIGIWLTLFLIIIAPFDASDLSFRIRLIILPFYGLIAVLSYLILIPLQNFIFGAIKKWNIGIEITYVFVYMLITLSASYVYYKSDIINGTFDLRNFIVGIYYPIFFIMLIIIVLSRWFINKESTALVKNKILLKGDNKLDVLNIEMSDLVCISSADNYIEVSYLKSGVMTKKLLRTTLKNIHLVVPSLVQVHRSHLINSLHFKDWKDSNNINLTGITVPISKRYKNSFLEMNHSSQIPNISPQSS